MYRLKIYALPYVQPSDYELLEPAVEGAKRELATKEHPAHATITDLQLGKIVVRLYLNSDGSINDAT